MLRADIYEAVKEAMKAREAEKLETIRFVWSEIKNVEIDAKHELSDEEVLAVLQREVKRRNDAIEQFKTGGRPELAEAEEKKLAVIKAFMPEMMGKADVERVVDEVIAAGASDFGGVMREVMAKLKGKADGKLVSEVVKVKLG